MTHDPPRVLVVYFSRTGTTQRVAEAIARGTNGEVEELRPRWSRRGPLGWLLAGYDGTYRRAAALKPLRRSPGDYDLVFVGTPTWNRALSSPVRGFLRTHRGELAQVAVFATCAGAGAETAMDQMAQLLDRPPLARLALLEGAVKHGAAPRIGEFAATALRRLEQGLGV